MTNITRSKIVPTQALRPQEEGKTPHVTNMELFFDLVYVFTIIQLSHYLLEHQTWLGALQTATLFAAVWWAWNYTAWATNWVNPDHLAGRLLMIFLMGCALLMAVAIPTAYSTHATLFVGAYVTMALVRGGFMALLFSGQKMGRNYTQLTIWSAASAVLWIAGVFLPANRTVIWILAVLIDYAGPYAGLWVPGWGRTPMSSWPLAGLHLLERNQQIFIIALGESILLLGGTLLGLNFTLHAILAALVGFLLIVLLWWIYFVNMTEKGEEAFAHSDNQTQLARSSLAYAHGIMVAGAIAIAVAIEQMVAHPDSEVHLPTILTTVIGGILFWVGAIIFHDAVAKKLPVSYVAAIVVLGIMGFITARLHVTGLELGLFSLLVTIGLVIATTSRQPHTEH